MKFIKPLIPWVKNLLNFMISTYAATGPGRIAHAKAEVCENLARRHKRLTDQLEDVDEQLRSAHRTRLALPSVKLALAGLAKEKTDRQQQQRQQQLLQQQLLQQQQQQNMASTEFAGQHSQATSYADILVDIANLDDRMLKLTQAREDLEKKLDGIARQMQRAAKQC